MEKFPAVVSGCLEDNARINAQSHYSSRCASMCSQPKNHIVSMESRETTHSNPHYGTQGHRVYTNQERWRPTNNSQLQQENKENHQYLCFTPSYHKLPQSTCGICESRFYGSYCKVCGPKLVHQPLNPPTARRRPSTGREPANDHSPYASVGKRPKAQCEYCQSYLYISKVVDSQHVTRYLCIECKPRSMKFGSHRSSWSSSSPPFRQSPFLETASAPEYANANQESVGSYMTSSRPLPISQRSDIVMSQSIYSRSQSISSHVSEPVVDFSYCLNKSSDLPKLEFYLDKLFK
jgi:hypothetical protein